MKYRTIVADPPWRYEDKLRMGSGPKHKGPANQYDCMRLADLQAMPVQAMAEPDSHLYLWTTNAFVVEAHDLAREWGFTPRTMLTWVKPSIGTGPFFRGSTEHVVFAVRGRLRASSRSAGTWFAAPRGRHSVKPEAFADIVEEVSPGPYLELFARSARPGWDCWGDEAPNPIEWATP